jgi:hypothetical protein
MLYQLATIAKQYPYWFYNIIFSNKLTDEQLIDATYCIPIMKNKHFANTILLQLLSHGIDSVREAAIHVCIDPDDDLKKCLEAIAQNDPNEDIRNLIRKKFNV